MALTAIDVYTSGQQIPGVVSAAAVSLDTGDGKGVALTNTGGKPRLVAISNDAAWAYHQTDGKVIADMRGVASGEVLRVQVPPGGTVNLYGKCAAATKLVVAVEF